MKAVIDIYKLQTRLTTNVVDGIDEKHAHTPLSDGLNHIAWLTGHIVSTRFMLTNVLGNENTEPYPELFAQGQGIQNVKYPSLSELMDGWDSVSHELVERITALKAIELQKDAPIRTPMGANLQDFIGFIASHEAYTIGQIGIMRRFLGYPAMKYS